MTKRPHPDSVRHSTAVLLLRSGVDIVTVSQWLGHASITITKGHSVSRGQASERLRLLLAGIMRRKSLAPVTASAVSGS